MMVADKMSNRPIRPNRPNGLIRLIISHLPRTKNATPKSRTFLYSLYD